MADEGDLDLLIATDCISEGQNLQDCDWLVNYDIHWNPVRIIQRFGRIDRIGSPNACIQLVNFWPNLELEEYLDLEKRVSGRMVLLDVSATGEENVIERQSGDQMNDLEYRRRQLLRLQETVIDLEDLSSGVSMTDLTLTDFRLDLAEYMKGRPGALDQAPLGAYAVTTAREADVPPGIVFCLRAEGPAASHSADSGYPLAPYYLRTSVRMAPCCCRSRRPDKSWIGSSVSVGAGMFPMKTRDHLRPGPCPRPAGLRPCRPPGAEGAAAGARRVHGRRQATDPGRRQVRRILLKYELTGEE